MQMAERHLKITPGSPVITEMQIHTTVRFQLKKDKVVNILKSYTNNLPTSLKYFSEK